MQRRPNKYKPPSRKTHLVVDELRHARIDANITLHDLSAQTGYGVNTISLNENGQRNPSFGMIVDIADALGYDLILQKRKQS